ncbi:hypothetical protein [Corynebacterium sp. A21]|uniref:hypothetical protein n=1 Tax=Corynebacterium sp. A21 TaxID=3457318 RepID=UPI003FD17438
MATQQEQWQEVKNLVAEHLSDLKGMDHIQIKDFATEHGLMTKSSFPKLKTVLKTKGINYEELREQASQQREQELDDRAETLSDDAAQGPQMVLSSAAVEHEGQASFAVVDGEKQAVWYGRFFEDDRIWTSGDPVSAEQSAADKAIWIAGKALKEHGASAGRLVLSVTHPELDTDALVRAGVRHSVDVTVRFDEDNAAVDMAQTPGFQKWQEYDLSQLIETEEEN